MRAFCVVLSLGTCIAALSASAHAQDASPPASAPGQTGQATAGDTEEIVVTGMRQSLEAARSIKRDSAQFVDAVVAADIGSLPDTNVAESLSRISGVQLERGVGEGSNIAIRGLRQNVTLYNGREIFDATGRGGSGVDELSTSTYGLLAIVPSELISRLEVTKLAGSNQIAGALGGIIDIHSRTALDNPGLHLTASAGGIYDSLPEKAGYEAFALASNTSDDGTFGYLFSVSYQKRFIAEQGLSTFSGYAAFNNGGVRRIGHSDVRAQQLSDERTKIGVSAVLQYRPSDALEVKADLLYSRLTADRDRYWLGFAPTAGLTNPVFSDNDVLLAGTARTTPNTNVSFYDVHNDILSTAIGADLKPNDRLKISGQIAIGKSGSQTTRNYVRLAPPSSAIASIPFDIRTGDFGAFDLSAFDLTDPAGLTMALFYDDGREVWTNDLQARADVERQFSGIVSSVQIGARYQRLESAVRPANALLRPNIAASALFPQYLGVFSNDNFLKGAFGNLPRSYLVALESAISSCRNFTAFPTISQDPACTNPSQSLNSLGSTFDINERFWNGYAKVNFDRDLGFARLQGNAGVRYIRRELESVGNILRGTTATPTTFRRSDNDFLPSVVAKFEFDSGLIARFGFAKVLAYPRTALLNNGIALSNDAVFQNGVQIQAGTGTGGSPDLDPFSADQYDASIEYYFGKEALISVGAFYKNVNSFVISTLSPERYNNTDYVISRATNGRNGKVKGVEVLFQQPFTFLPAPLDGFGVLATYSYIDSTTPFVDGAGRNLTFPGLSRHNVNLVGYYEKGPIDVRLAYNWRDHYLLSQNGSTRNGIYNDSYRDLAATVRYKVIKNVELRFEGINLLNSRQRAYDGLKEALVTNVVFGRVFKFGGSLSF